MFEDYELIDFGDGRKLERFGSVILDRPEVLAKGARSLSKHRWRQVANAAFIETSKTNGRWEIYSAVPKEWSIGYSALGKSWKAKLGLSPFKHIGIFPEQQTHWQHIMREVRQGDRVINLFGYTGAASLSAAASGGDVYHIDSSKSIVNKAAENARLNGFDQIRWVVEDALAFAKKEVKRGHKYRFVIMDPPVYGRGKKGEHWKLEDLLPELIQVGSHLLDKEGVIILNTYSPKVSLEDMVGLAQNARLGIKDKGWLSVSVDGRELNLSRFITCSSA
jgi:23S rRNA (cytosine1962-C5)-methyltransferase